MITCVIVDDESAGRMVLKHLLKNVCPELKVLGEANNIKEAYKLINKYQPSLVFLDIYMPPYGDGFDLLKMFEDVFFEVIFVTAYNDKAVEAFRFSAVDYLTKPINKAHLEEAVSKVKTKVEVNDFKELLPNLLHNLNGKPSRLALPLKHGKRFVDVQEILRCEANGSDTFVYLKNNNKLWTSRGLRRFEVALKDKGFCRVHRAHLVNFNEVVDFQISNAKGGGGGNVLLTDGSIIPVSRSHKDNCRAYFKEI